MYADVFAKVITERSNLLIQTYELKQYTDKIIKKGKGKQGDFDYLLKRIGKDHFFRKAETVNAPSLRHQLYKICKSTEFILKRERMVITEIASLNIKEDDKKVILFYFNRLRAHLEKGLILFYSMDGVFIEEAKAISLGNLEKYIGLLQRESEIKTQLAAFYSDLRLEAEQFAESGKSFIAQNRTMFGIFAVMLSPFLIGLAFSGGDQKLFRAAIAGMIATLTAQTLITALSALQRRTVRATIKELSS